MKLYIINPTCNQGSHGKISEQVGLLAIENGWEVRLAHGARRVQPSKLSCYPFSSKFIEYRHALYSLIFDGDGQGSKFSTKNLINDIKAYSPNVVHIHNLHGYYLNLQILFDYLSTTDIKVVITLHDCWNFTGHCVHFVTANCEKWKTGCHKCPLQFSGPSKSIIDRSERNFNLKMKLLTTNRNIHLVAVSDWVAGLVKQSFLRHIPLSVIKNGIDLSIFNYARKKISGGRFKILAVSNVWHRDKGEFDIYELNKILDHNQYEIIMVGLSKSQMKNLPKGILGLHPVTNQQDLANIYGQADVLINPTYADTFPTINLESIACGTPVITYETGGSVESITEHTGKVVARGNVEALAKAIIHMKENPISSETCANYALRYFDKNKCFSNYVNLYSKIHD